MFKKSVKITPQPYGMKGSEELQQDLLYLTLAYKDASVPLSPYFD